MSSLRPDKSVLAKKLSLYRREGRIPRSIEDFLKAKIMDLFGLKGRVAVVTGASSGLGADAARAYAAYGADVALVARRKERLESLAEELRREGVKALPVACDVSREDDVRAAVERIMDYFGRVDILLNDAGVAVPGGVETLTARGVGQVDGYKRPGDVLDVQVCRSAYAGKEIRQDSEYILRECHPGR